MENVIVVLINFFVILGCVFVFVAALGVYRFPDFYTRMHAATKAGAFGGANLAIAAALEFANVSTVIQAILIVAFFYITTPVASHLLGRAAYLRGVYRFERKNKNDEA